MRGGDDLDFDDDLGLPDLDDIPDGVEEARRRRPRIGGRDEGTDDHSAGEVRALNLRPQYVTRRAFSESELDRALDWNLRDGTTYFIITGGTVDSMSFIRHVAKNQHIDYMAVTSWTMARGDAQELAAWLSRGIVDRADVYLGDNFDQLHPDAWREVSAAVTAHGGRAATAWIHAKMCVFFGERYSGTIAGSANLNTNTRTEQTVIMCSRDVAEFTKRYIDTMTPKTTRQARGWTPWGDF